MYGTECMSLCMKYCHASSTSIATPNRAADTRNGSASAGAAARPSAAAPCPCPCPCPCPSSLRTATEMATWIHCCRSTPLTTSFREAMFLVSSSRLECSLYLSSAVVRASSASYMPAYAQYTATGASVTTSSSASMNPIGRSPAGRIGSDSASARAGRRHRQSKRSGGLVV
uniref:Uncharacterized protein n=1 Tax=Zea mays TaxID=4577 RepID=C4J6P5_MAIZE|nr:unknown [Zea mays]